MTTNPAEHTRGSPDPNDAPDGARGPARPMALLAAVPDTTQAEEGAPAPQWPSAGWALHPRGANGQPARARAQAYGAGGRIAVALVVVLGGLFAWFAYNSFTSQTTHAWAPNPQGQPYYVPHVIPDVPAAAASKKLPPMLVSTPSANVTLKIDAPPLGGMYGGTGDVQDAYSPAYFAVPANTTVHVTVVNYDPAWHTFTAPALGLNVWVQPAGAHPTVTSFSFTAPKTGYFEWFCDLPCDGYSMEGPGYMEGEIHAVKA